MSDVPVDAPSAGTLLREAREKQGLHIAALAAAIKVAPRKLDALEHDRWDELPDATFARALAQTVCGKLKIDPRPVLDRLPRAGTLALEPGHGGLNAPFHDRPGREEPGLALAAVRPMVWAASLLMVAAIAVYFVPEGLLKPRAAPPAAVPTAAALPALPPALAASAATVAADAAQASAAPASAPPAELASSAAVETVFSSPQQAQADAVPPAGPVQLRASEASWVEVRDSGGRLLVSRTVLPGESLGLDGSLPLRLTIGNAAATQLAFRGQAIDLGPSTRDNVARVELK